MTADPDYYAILQVDSRAEAEVIEAAYRRLAAKYHPDVNHSPEALQRMKLLNAAYAVLSNPEKRNAYDVSRTGYHRQKEPAVSTLTRKRPWWLLAVAVSTIALALRFSPRLLFVLVPLLLVVWVFWNRR
ncbi:MAG: DnaJ domain-containing protein [Pseudomonadota bacterium]